MTMRERPILFNSAMVRAILDGRKTQTRRPIKPQPKPIPADVMATGGPSYRSDHWWPCSWAKSMIEVRDMACRCPFGYRRDRLWVRETWRRAPEGFPDGIQYREKTTLRYFDGSDPAAAEAAAALPRDGRWRPSIHMPRWASRITLEITDVRVERVQDISEDDAIAEGVATRDAFAALWRSTYGDESWGVNPWVWVVEFRRVEVGS